MGLKGNPLTDRRFRKLVESDRCLPKQVMDYVKQHCPKVQEGKGGGKGKKGKGGKGKNKDQDQVRNIKKLYDLNKKFNQNYNCLY